MSADKVKYNINFGKALKVLERQGFEKYINDHFADKTARLARNYITDGKVKPQLSDNNPRKIKNKSARPLFDTGKLAYSLKGTLQGISGVKYGKYHRQKDGFKAWGKFQTPPKSVQPPKEREFIPHFKEDGKIAIRGTKSDVSKIYKDFKVKFTKLLSKRMGRWRSK